MTRTAKTWLFVCVAALLLTLFGSFSTPGKEIVCSMTGGAWQSAVPGTRPGGALSNAPVATLGWCLK
jgi:hypothetical protein